MATIQAGQTWGNPAQGKTIPLIFLLAFRDPAGQQKLQISLGITILLQPRHFVETYLGMSLMDVQSSGLLLVACTS